MNATEIGNRKKDPEKLEEDPLYIQHLEKKIKENKIEIDSLRKEITRIEYEIKSLQADLARFSELPLLTGYIIDTLDNRNDRAIVDCPPSSNFIVRISNKIQKNKINNMLITTLSPNINMCRVLIHIGDKHVNTKKDLKRKLKYKD